MTLISDITIKITPFNLQVRVDAANSEERIRGTDVVLRAIEIEDARPHDRVTILDVLEYVAPRLDAHGLSLQFLAETTDDNPEKIHLKRMDLTKRFGHLLSGGQDSLSYTDGTNVWQWSALKTLSGAATTEMISGTGEVFQKLCEVPVADLRHVLFSFGVAPAV